MQRMVSNRKAAVSWDPVSLWELQERLKSCCLPSHVDTQPSHLLFSQLLILPMNMAGPCPHRAGSPKLCPKDFEATSSPYPTTCSETYCFSPSSSFFELSRVFLEDLTWSCSIQETWFFKIHEHLLVQLIRLLSCHPVRSRGNGAQARESFDGEGKDWNLGKNKPRAVAEKGIKSEDPRVNKKRGWWEGLLGNVALL